MTNGEQLAFPFQMSPECTEWHYGLTKREYIAALALQGLLANSNNPLTSEQTADIAVKAADILLEKLA